MLLDWRVKVYIGQVTFAAITLKSLGNPHFIDNHLVQAIKLILKLVVVHLVPMVFSTYEVKNSKLPRWIPIWFPYYLAASTG